MKAAESPRRWDVLWIIGLIALILIALVLNSVVALQIGLKRPDYFRDYTTNSNPDALHYVLLGETFLKEGHYSRQGEPPYQPDILRPPVYPLLAGAVQVGCGTIWPLYALQVLCSMGTSLLLYSLATSLYGRTVGFLAGMLCAADGVLATLNFEAMTEPVFTLLVTAAVALWLRLVWPSKGTTYSWKHAAGAGLLIGVAALTRPTGLYLAVVFGGMQVLIALYRRDRRLFGHACALVATTYLLVVPWIVRNFMVFGIPRLTITDTVGLVYNAAAGAYEVQLGIPREEAQRRIRDEFGLVDHDLTLNYWRVDQPIAEIDAAQRAAIPHLLRKYPASLVRATLTGIVKSFLSHHASTLAHMSGQPWHTVGLDTLLRGQVGTFFQEIMRNDPGVVVAFLWQMLLNVAVPLFAILGLVSLLRSPHPRAPAVALIVVIGYYLATIAVIGLDAYCRHRAMIVPLVCLFAALGVRWGISLCGWRVLPEPKS